MKEPEIEDFPITGVRATREFLESIAGGAHTLLTYHSDWLRNSGVGRKSSSAHVHRAIMEAFRLMITFDQVDPTSLASAEHLARWAIQTELAVERIPRVPTSQVSTSLLVQVCCLMEEPTPRNSQNTLLRD